MGGKAKCEMLKSVRKDIADANGIPLEIPECTHEGECPGTCPRCEAEVRYLERELENRKKSGLPVKIEKISNWIMTKIKGIRGDDADPAKPDQVDDRLAGEPVPIWDDPDPDDRLAGDSVPTWDDPDPDDRLAGAPHPPDIELSGKPTPGWDDSKNNMWDDSF